MEDIKRLGLPVVIICSAAFLTKGIENYFTGEFVHTILSILTVAFLFIFGVTLNRNRKKKSSAVFRKVFAILIVLLLLFMQLGYFELPYVSNWFSFLGMKSFYINMLYIFCGYLFVD